SFTINGFDFKYGSFLSSVINFLIMALILFLLIKGMNKLMEIGQKKKEEAPAAPPEPSKEEVLLTEIRDLLKAQNSAEATEEKTK
ncbi:MAG: MscL family protein, partial [Oscillospiraceae bacterium]|nr:MscL family protein [Oscillospiraceae bacterium]